MKAKINKVEDKIGGHDEDYFDVGEEISNQKKWEEALNMKRSGVVAKFVKFVLKFLPQDVVSDYATEKLGLMTFEDAFEQMEYGASYRKYDYD